MFKGKTAQAETIRRRPYHQAYYAENRARYRAYYEENRSKKPRVPCPNCSGSMLAGRKQCSRCDSLTTHRNLCSCGRLKTRESKRCWYCAGQKVDRNTRIRASRTRNPYCPNLFDGAGACETQAPHNHCECGWPIAVRALVCHICIAEQKRIEFKIRPTEVAA